jgi:aminoglycoside phosphotransferase (APT) family kinase protein
VHDGEFQIDGTLVRTLIDEQFPRWRELPMDRVQSSGTVHAIYRLGDALAVRLPTHPSFTAALEREAELLPRIGRLLPLAIPELIAIGRPTDHYPSAWSIVRWLEGGDMATEVVDDPVDAAERLGRFVVAMRSITLDGAGSENQRGKPLVAIDEWTRRSIASLADEFNRNDLTSLWESALSVAPWDRQSRWIHGDLLPANLIVDDGRLSAVIDFGECSLGNPTCDLIAGWWVFEGKSRRAFKDAAKADANSWNRARGWALSGAVGALSYYRETNHEFADMARRTVRNVMMDQ